MKLHLSSTYSFKEMEWYYLIPEGLAKMSVPQWHEDDKTQLNTFIDINI